MVQKYPDLERGESASKTGRDHIPLRVFKEMPHLTKQKAKLEELLASVNAFNAKGKAAEIGELAGQVYSPIWKRMDSAMKKYRDSVHGDYHREREVEKEKRQLLANRWIKPHRKAF